MSTPDPIGAGMLEVLDDLHEEGRRRFIRRRTKEELEELIVAAWRERDDALNLMEEYEDEPRLRSVTSGPDSQSLYRERNNLRRSETAHSMATETNGAPGLKREPTPSPAPGRKRIRRVTPSPHAEQAPVQRSRDDHEDGERFRPSRELLQMSRKGGRQHDTSQLDKTVFIPVGTKHVQMDHVDIGALPEATRTVLLQRFRTFLLKYPAGEETLPLDNNTAAAFKRSLCCICGMLRGDAKRNEIGKLISGQTFQKGGKLRRSADDRCIADKVPCAYIFRHNKTYRIGFVPLPKEQRITENWKDLKYWVR